MTLKPSEMEYPEMCNSVMINILRAPLKNNVPLIHAPSECRVKLTLGTNVPYIDFSI